MALLIAYSEALHVSYYNYVQMQTCLSVCMLSVCLFVVCTSVCLSVCLMSARLSVCLSVCLSECVLACLCTLDGAAVALASLMLLYIYLVYATNAYVHACRIHTVYAVPIVSTAYVLTKSTLPSADNPSGIHMHTYLPFKLQPENDLRKAHV